MKPGEMLDESNPEHQPIIEALVIAGKGSRSPELDADPIYIAADKNIAFGRYNGALYSFVPWLRRYFPDPKKVIEIGCGTGSTTAAFASACESLIGYDFDDASLRVARKRLELLGVANAEVHNVPGNEGAAIFKEHPQVDGVILFAVLEHMTGQERLDVLKAGWDALQPGGFLLIAETPNRLIYWDFHTTNLPFFNLLSEDVALAYHHRSERTDTKNNIAMNFAAKGVEGAKLALVRAGYSGASYHEFEIALGPDYASHIVSSPDDPEVATVYGDQKIEEEALASYVEKKGLNIHPSFCKSFLTLLFRKP